jgi:hypothetical protein
MDDAVMTELKRRLTEVDRLDVSRYQFINMDRLKHAAGSAWPDMRTRVFIATRTMIERRIAEDDLIIPCATGYLVIYKALSGKLAENTTNRIREEMERFFFGDGQLSALGVEAMSEQLSVAEFEAALAAADLDLTEDEAQRHLPDLSPASAPTIEGLDFCAVWDARKQAAASYFVMPRSKDGPNTPVYKPDRADPRLDFDLDILDRAALALERLIDTGSRCAVIVPVGFSNVSMPRTRASYVTALARLPEALKPLIWLRLEDAPSNAPGSIMGETGRILLGQSKQLYIDTALDAVSLASQAETGASHVGASLVANRGSSQRADLDRINALARRKGLTTYVDGINRVEDLRVALNAGVDLVAGRAIGIYDAPCAPFRLSAEALLDQVA